MTNNTFWKPLEIPLSNVDAFFLKHSCTTKNKLFWYKCFSKSIFFPHTEESAGHGFTDNITKAVTNTANIVQPNPVCRAACHSSSIHRLLLRCGRLRAYNCSQPTTASFEERIYLKHFTCLWAESHETKNSCTFFMFFQAEMETSFWHKQGHVWTHWIHHYNS